MSRGPLHYTVAGPRVIKDPHAHEGSPNMFMVDGLPTPSPTFATREEAAIWLAEEMTKQPANRMPRARACMTCGASFMSAGIHNRMCDPCRRRAQDMDGVVHPLIRGSRKGR